VELFMLTVGYQDDKALFQADHDALYGEDAYDQKQHYLDFIDRFAAIVADPHSVSQSMQSYLTNGALHEVRKGEVGAGDMLYWLDKQLKANKVAIGYTDRLSEAGAGWGEAAPDLLSEADPFDLVTTLESLSVRVVIVDHDAVADAAGDAADATKRDTVVRCDRDGASDEPCTTLSGTAKSYDDGSGASDDLLNNTTDTYRYRFFKTLVDWNERSGSRLRYPDGDVESMTLIRNTASDHIVNVENQLGCTLASQTQNTRITIRGYPGEWPEIWCGNSADDDTTPTVVPSGGRDATAATFTISPAADKGRDNVHWRNIIFHGKRETAGGKWFFAENILSITGNGSGHSVRFCQFLDFQPIRVDDALAAANPEYVDEGTVVISGTTLARGSESTVAFTAIDATSDDLVIDSNYFQAADEADFPHGPNAGDRIDATGVEGMCIDLGSSTPGGSANTRITRNRIEGVKHNSAVRAVVVDGLYIADNDMEVFDKTILTLAGCSNGVIERNRLHDYADNEHADEGGGNAISLTGCDNFIVRHNVIFNHETQLSGGGITIQSTDANDGTYPDYYVYSEGHAVYENIFYRTGVKFDHNDPGTTTDCSVYNNLIAGMPETLKGSALTNAPVYVSMNRTGVATLEGNLIYENAIWRFANATPTQGTIESGDHLMVRTGAGTSSGYETTESLTGWYDNTQVLPVWDGLPESDDFRVSSSNAYAAWFSNPLPFRAADSQAWTPD
jgi:hypothetical protein